MKFIPSKLSLSIFIIWLFHISGTIGILIGYKDWFVALTPLNLGICFAALLLNLESISLKDIGVLMIPFFIGFLAEFLGVNFGLIFGDYSYGANLGYKLFGVPLMIGINWVVLVYATSGISKQFIRNRWGAAFAGASLMVLLDFFMEKSAPHFDFWQFKDNVVPMQNYVGWFIVSFIAHLIFQKLFRKENSILCWNLYVVMSVFFIIFYFVYFT